MTQLYTAYKKRVDNTVARINNKKLESSESYILNDINQQLNGFISEEFLTNTQKFLTSCGIKVNARQNTLSTIYGSDINLSELTTESFKIYKKQGAITFGENQEAVARDLLDSMSGIFTDKYKLKVVQNSLYSSVRMLPKLIAIYSVFLKHKSTSLQDDIELLNNLTDENQSISNQKAQLKRQVQTITLSNNILNQDVSQLHNRLQMQTQLLSQNKQEIATLTENLARIFQSIDSTKQSINNLKVNYAESKLQQERLVIDDNEFKTQYSQITLEINQKREQLLGLQQNVNQLQTTLDTLINEESLIISSVNAKDNLFKDPSLLTIKELNDQVNLHIIYKPNNMNASNFICLSLIGLLYKIIDKIQNMQNMQELFEIKNISIFDKVKKLPYNEVQVLVGKIEQLLHKDNLDKIVLSKQLRQITDSFNMQCINKLYIPKESNIEEQLILYCDAFIKTQFFEQFIDRNLINVYGDTSAGIRLNYEEILLQVIRNFNASSVKNAKTLNNLLRNIEAGEVILGRRQLQELNTFLQNKVIDFYTLSKHSHKLLPIVMNCGYLYVNYNKANKNRPFMLNNIDNKTYKSFYSYDLRYNKVNAEIKDRIKINFDLDDCASIMHKDSVFYLFCHNISSSSTLIDLQEAMKNILDEKVINVFKDFIDIKEVMKFLLFQICNRFHSNLIISNENINSILENKQYYKLILDNPVTAESFDDADFVIEIPIISSIDTDHIDNKIENRIITIEYFQQYYYAKHLNSIIHGTISDYSNVTMYKGLLIPNDHKSERNALFYSSCIDYIYSVNLSQINESGQEKISAFLSRFQLSQEKQNLLNLIKSKGNAPQITLARNDLINDLENISYLLSCDVVFIDNIFFTMSSEFEKGIHINGNESLVTELSKINIKSRDTQKLFQCASIIVHIKNPQIDSNTRNTIEEILTIAKNNPDNHNPFKLSWLMALAFSYNQKVSKSTHLGGLGNEENGHEETVYRITVAWKLLNDHYKLQTISINNCGLSDYFRFNAASILESGVKIQSYEIATCADLSRARLALGINQLIRNTVVWSLIENHKLEIIPSNIELDEKDQDIRSFKLFMRNLLVY